MPANRNGTYYVKRNFRGVGRIVRSLQTRSRTRAAALENALLSLHAQGRLELIRAFADGRLPIEQIGEAFETGRVPELSAGLRQQTETLGVAVARALRHKAADVKSSTLERYATGLDHFQSFTDPQAIVREVLTEESIQAFKADRLAAGAARETINNDLGAISVLASYCLARGWLDRRPEIRRYASGVRIRYLEPDQITAYMAALRPAFRPLFQLLIGTGMRLGEAEALSVGNLRFGDDGVRALVEDAKTPAGNRPVFVPTWVATGLIELIDSHGLDGSDKLFRFGRRTVQAEHSRARELVGLTHYTIHDHRHTAAVHMSRTGMPINLIQRQLGHSNISQTMRYAHFNPEYADYGHYFDRIEERFGLSSGHNPGYSEDSVEPVTTEAIS